MLGSGQWRVMFVTRTLLNKATQSFGSSLEPALESNEGGNTELKKKKKRKVEFTRNKQSVW